MENSNKITFNQLDRFIKIGIVGGIIGIIFLIIGIIIYIIGIIKTGSIIGPIVLASIGYATIESNITGKPISPGNLI